MNKINQKNSKISLRQVGPGDNAFLKEVYAGTRPDVMDNPVFDDKQKSDFIESQFNLQDVQYRKHYRNAEFMIISEGGRDSGRLYLYEDKKEIRIMDIAILPAFRGRGTGAFLIGELQTKAIQSGKSVSIHVEENNPAKKLYDRLGFVEQGEKVNGVYQLMVWDPNQVST